MDGTDIRVIHSNTGVFWGLAVEWNSLQIYWTDSTNGTVSASDLEGEDKRILWSSKPGHPDGIGLDPYEGALFWTLRIWESVWRSTMYEAQVERIVGSSPRHPFSITLERQNEFVFWMDEVAGTVEPSDYDGNNRRSFFELKKRRSFFSYTEVFFYSSDLFFISYNKYKI